MDATARFAVRRTDEELLPCLKFAILRGVGDAVLYLVPFFRLVRLPPCQAAQGREAGKNHAVEERRRREARKKLELVVIQCRKVQTTFSGRCPLGVVLWVS